MTLDKLTYVDEAEKVIQSLGKDSRGNLFLTTSKLRNILSMVSEIYNDAIHAPDAPLSTDLQGRVQYLRLRIAYECGRERSVKDFVEQANLLEHMKNIGASKEKLILFCNYMEALVAYHKYYGGKD